MNAKVPNISFAEDLSVFLNARPQSMTASFPTPFPSGEQTTFCGLMSQWMIALEWAEERTVSCGGGDGSEQILNKRDVCTHDHSPHFTGLSEVHRTIILNVTV